MRRLPVIGIYEPSPGPSGPSRYVDSLLAAMDPDEFRAVVFGHAAGPYHDRPGIAFIPVCGPGGPGAEGRPTRAKASSSWWRRFTPGCARLWTGFGRDALRLAAQFRRRPVDLLHTNNTGCEESAVAARLAGVPSVLGTFHVDSSYDLHAVRSGIAHRVLEYASNHCLHRAIAVSRSTGADWMRRTRLARGRVLTIHNGIDPERFSRRSTTADARRRLGLPADGSTVLGAVGRLDEAKGFGHLLDAFALLGGEFPDLFLVIAGDGPLRARLEDQAERLAISKRVQFSGFRRDVQEIYDALDVFVLPSLCEALPYALLEAMSTRLPAVASRVSGIAEVVVPGTTGELAPPADAAALAAALRPLIASVALRQRMGIAGRQRVVEHFTESRMARQTLGVYRQMLGGPPR